MKEKQKAYLREWQKKRQQRLRAAEKMVKSLTKAFRDNNLTLDQTVEAQAQAWTAVYLVLKGDPEWLPKLEALCKKLGIPIPWKKEDVTWKTMIV